MPQMKLWKLNNVIRMRVMKMSNKFSQILTVRKLLVKVDNVTVLSHPQAEYNSEGTIIKPAGMYLLNVQDIPTFISIKPMPFVKGSSVEFKELMIYIKDNFQFAPKTLENGNHLQQSILKMMMQTILLHNMECIFR